MRIAVLIAGFLRGFKNNIESLQTNLLFNYECDIYIHITDTNESKYINENIDIDYIKQALNPKLILVSKDINFIADSKKNNLLNQNHKYYWLNEERKKITKAENIKYNAIVKIRPDTHLNSKINIDLFSLCIFVPDDAKIDCKRLANKNDPYICDIIAYGNETVMNKYFDYYLHIESLIHKYTTTINETLLYYYLQDIPLQQTNIDYYILLSKCNVIAITGDSGAGKSTLANILKEIFVDNFILECDRYHKWERNNECWNQYTHLNPEANYITKMCNDVFDLKIGNSIYQVDYDHATGKFTDKTLIESKNNIIICGLHSLYAPENLLNLKIFIDTDDNLRIPWKLRRDIIKRGYSIEHAYKQIINRKQDYDRYVLPQKDVADIVIHYYTNFIFNIETYSQDAELPVFLKITLHRKYCDNYFHNSILSIDYIEDNKATIYYKPLCAGNQSSLDYNKSIYHLLIYIKNF